VITCIREAWVEQNGEHYIEYHYFCDQCRGTTISPDPTPHCSVRCRQPSDELTRLRTLAEAATRLVATLPQCDITEPATGIKCTKPATRAANRNMPRFCDEHGPKVREYPRAQAPRDTIAALAALEKQ